MHKRLDERGVGLSGAACGHDFEGTGTKAAYGPYTPEETKCFFPPSMDLAAIGAASPRRAGLAS
jgi:hypothetical protein